jgi:rod shape-determining protein MreC
VAISRTTGSRTRLVVLVLASVTALVLGARDVPVVSGARDAATTAVQPLESVVEGVTAPVRNAWHGITDYDDVRRENERLRSEVAERDAQQVRTSDAEKQLAELSEALDMPWVGEVPTVTARVTSGPGSNFSQAIRIDKGTDHGIADGMPVATGAGLVGRVSRAGSTSATIELITEPQFRVGIRLAESGDLGTARGRGLGDPLVVDTALGPRDSVDDGTGLVTSGVDRSAFPAGIPVARVSDTRAASGGLALELLAEPLAEVDRLSYLTVLRWEETG